jgi:3'-5' exoribonuclease
MRQYIADVSDGDTLDGVFLLADKQLRANRNANLYLLVDLRDRSGGLHARMWNVSEAFAATLRTGQLVRAGGKVQLFQGTLQAILNQISPVSSQDYDLSEFIPRASVQAEHLGERLRAILRQVEHPHLQALVQAFLNDGDLMARLIQAPAGVKTHHAAIGGLIEHVVSMLEVALRVAPLYPTLNLDLLLTGVFLHDLGKVRELAWDVGLTYTDEGQLLGHVVLVLELLQEKVRAAEAALGEPLDADLLLQLKHLIVSHHGAYEFGASRLPMTPEALALWLIDTLDAKLHEFTQQIESDPNTNSNWTPFNPRLDRKLFKGGRTTRGA